MNISNSNIEMFTPEVVTQMNRQKQLTNHVAELRKQKQKEYKEEDDYFNAPTPLPPMTPGTFELMLEDDDVADLVESDIPATDDDSIQSSTSGHFSQHDFAVPTPFSKSNTTSSSPYTNYTSSSYIKTGYFTNTSKWQKVKMSQNTMIYHAMLRDLDKLKQMLNQGQDVNIRDEYGDTPLHATARFGYQDASILLYNRGANIHNKNYKGYTPLSSACVMGRLATCEWLVSIGSDIMVTDKQESSLLHIACQHGHVDLAKWLIQQGLNVTQEDCNGFSPIHIACRHGHSTVVEYLLGLGVDCVNLESNTGITPLQIAAENGLLETCKLLYKCGAKIGTTSLTQACIKGHLKVVTWLIETGVSIDSKNSDAQSALHCASEFGHLDLVKYLAKQGANVNINNKERNTPLHVASHSGYSDICKFLLSKGAKIDIENVNGNTALHAACENGHLEAVRILWEYGANVYVMNNQRFTPVMLATLNEHGRIVNYLNTLPSNNRKSAFVPYKSINPSSCVLIDSISPEVTHEGSTSVNFSSPSISPLSISPSTIFEMELQSQDIDNIIDDESVNNFIQIEATSWHSETDLMDNDCRKEEDIVSDIIKISHPVETITENTDVQGMEDGANKISLLQVQIAQLKLQLDEKNKILSELNEEVMNYKNKANEAMQQLSTLKTQENNIIDTEEVVFNDMINDKTREVEERNQIIAQKGKSLKVMADHFQTIRQKEIAEKDNLIQNQMETINSATGIIVSKGKKLAMKTDKIIRKGDKIASKAEQLVHTNGKIVSKPHFNGKGKKSFNEGDNVPCTCRKTNGKHMHVHRKKRRLDNSEDSEPDSTNNTSPVMNGMSTVSKVTSANRNTYNETPATVDILRYVDKAFLDHCNLTSSNATKLAVKLLRTMFPTDILVDRSAFGQGRNGRPALNTGMVKALLDYVQSQYPNTAKGLLIRAINQACSDARKVKKRMN